MEINQSTKVQFNCHTKKEYLEMLRWLQLNCTCEYSISVAHVRFVDHAMATFFALKF